MSDISLINSAHQPGHTCLAFAKDGSRIYTGGSDSLVRIWKTNLGAEQEPDVAIEAMDGITTVAAGNNAWFSGSEDADVRQYEKDKHEVSGLVTTAIGVPIRCVAVDPKGQRITVTSDEPTVKVIDIEDTTKMFVLKGHTKAVRQATWHPSGSLLTTSGADGKIVAWDVSDSEPKNITTIEGIIPEVYDTDSADFRHDCSAVWHTSGQYFIVATRAHEIISISRTTWSKSATFSDPSCSGATTALALSHNGIYLASASTSGISIWSTQTRRLLFRYQGSVTAPVTKIAFSPTQNLLAWIDTDGVLTRWPDPIPSSSPDPVKLISVGAAVGIPKKRGTTPNLFGDDVEEKDDASKAKDLNLDEEDEYDATMGDLDDDNWILDDIGGGLQDDDGDAKWAAKEGIKEMAQPPFQPGSTPMENKKRYLAYNMIGVIEVTDQDTHHIVNVEFHDRSARKSYHFTDHFKYELASLGERGALYACPPEASHPAHVLYKPYGTWASQSEWQYELPQGTRVIGLAAGGPPPTQSMRQKNDMDIQGNGNVVIATSDGELIFLTGGGVERHVMSLPGDFVCMCAGREWVFIVTRDGSTTMDGSQNLTGRLIKFDDFCMLQKDTVPIPKGHTLKWIGISEEGAPIIYDSSGVLNALPRFRIPFAATWTRVLNTNTLDRKEGKHESYWPVGVSGETFMCLILKGRQEHPGFPRPLIQELPLKFPFKRTDAKEGPLEEQFARETMLLDILRDGLDEDELTSTDISRRELALDKSLIQLIQFACKNDKLSRALDIAKLLHHTASFDMAIKVAGFYHLIGLQEKLEALKDDREDGPDKLEAQRERRRDRNAQFVPIPDNKRYSTFAAEPARPKPFQDFRPPPAIPRPGLERAAGASTKATGTSQITESSQFSMDDEPSFDFNAHQDIENSNYSQESSPDGKRKRFEEDSNAENDAKRRAVGDSAGDMRTAQARSNPFARKPGAVDNRNPFTKSTETNKSVHKSDSFFNKIDAAETEKPKRTTTAKGKSKDKKETGRQTTLFGLPAVPPPEKKAPGRKKKANVAEESQSQSQRGSAEPTAKPAEEKTSAESQDTDVTMLESQESQVLTELAEESQERTASPEPIDWPDSPAPVEPEESTLVEIVA
ncbi:unnamed protein product [Somion occarium]|uniref:Minichromosome loss protein Mcl1 middle region domain-containing protein n=1 Tax=Somion occarium TaxID=3059160 RepID=A0ABP1DH05_9APHY